MIRRGDRGPAVRAAQKLLNAVDSARLVVDGLFGPKTETAVLDFQIEQGLLADGIVGPVTWGKLHRLSDREKRDETTSRLEIVRVEGMKTYQSDGYRSARLREDAAAALSAAQEELNAAGGHMTSSGGLRGLHARVSASRSATSLHYTGRAVDMFVYSGMVDPHKDPFVCTRDPESHRHFIVWARVQDGESRVLNAVTYYKSDDEYPQKMVSVEGRFINFTELMADHGFQRIGHRPRFLHPTDRRDLHAEWWHFQFEKGLVPGETTFGEELLRIYPASKLRGTPPWRYRHHVWGTNWF